MEENLYNFFIVDAAIRKNGILPADLINFELRDISINIKTIETFNKEIHSGIMVKCDVEDLDLTYE
ncbi:unnamed protein product [marine sediment metagenome]|uniref:Uncharacterized protein n=1 Tax=marine sediment metagenome TaxID=412755 RepID=X1DAB3_9ZZZZ